MRLSELIAERMIEGMDRQGKMDMALKLADHLVSSLGSEDRKELMVRMFPSMMEKMFEGLGPQEKVALVRQLMPRLGDILMGTPSR